MKKPYAFWTYLSGYPIPVLVSVGQTRNQIEAELKRRGGCTRETCLKDWQWQPTSNTQGHTAVLPCNKTVLWLYTDRLTVDLHGTITHEVFHLVYGIFDQIGMKLSDDSEEAYAYAIGLLAMKVIGGLLRRSKR